MPISLADEAPLRKLDERDDRDGVLIEADYQGVEDPILNRIDENSFKSSFEVITLRRQIQPTDTILF